MWTSTSVIGVAERIRNLTSEDIILLTAAALNILDDAAFLQFLEHQSTEDLSMRVIRFMDLYFECDSAHNNVDKANADTVINKLLIVLANR